MPYIYCDHIKCRFCGRSECLFFYNVTEIGNKAILRKCRECYRDGQREYYYRKKVFLNDIRLNAIKDCPNEH